MGPRAGHCMHTPICSLQANLLPARGPASCPSQPPTLAHLPLGGGETGARPPPQTARPTLGRSCPQALVEQGSSQRVPWLRQSAVGRFGVKAAARCTRPTVSRQAPTRQVFTSVPASPRAAGPRAPAPRDPSPLLGSPARAARKKEQHRGTPPTYGYSGSVQSSRPRWGTPASPALSPARSLRKSTRRDLRLQYFRPALPATPNVSWGTPYGGGPSRPVPPHPLRPLRPYPAHPYPPPSEAPPPSPAPSQSGPAPHDLAPAHPPSLIGAEL